MARRPLPIQTDRFDVLSDQYADLWFATMALADLVLTLNPTAGELGEGMARQMQDAARRCKDLNP